MPVQRSMADFTGHLRGVPKNVPMQSLRFAVIELGNFLLTQGLRAKATVFLKLAFEIRLH